MHVLSLKYFLKRWQKLHPLRKAVFLEVKVKVANPLDVNRDDASVDGKSRVVSPGGFHDVAWGSEDFDKSNNCEDMINDNSLELMIWLMVILMMLVMMRMTMMMMMMMTIVCNASDVDDADEKSNPDGICCIDKRQGRQSCRGKPFRNIWLLYNY